MPAEQQERQHHNPASLPCPCLPHDLPPAPHHLHPAPSPPAARKAAADLQASNQQRRKQLEGLNQQLAATRSAMFTVQLPTHMRYQSLTYSHVAAMLLRDQRQKVGAVLRQQQGCLC